MLELVGLNVVMVGCLVLVGRVKFIFILLVCFGGLLVVNSCRLIRWLVLKLVLLVFGVNICRCVFCGLIM